MHSQKGQGALEYLLLIGGAILITSVVIVILTSIGPSGTGYANNAINVYGEKFNTFEHSVGGGGTDISPPGLPTGFSATAGDTEVTLSWANPSDADLAGIEIRYTTGTTSAPANETEGSQATNCTGYSVNPGDSTGCTHTGLTNGTQYNYSIFAYDAVSNYSIPAVSASATPLATAVCLNGTVEGSEECDPPDWGLYGTCAEIPGYDSGTLGCNNCTYDLSQCTPDITGPSPPSNPSATNINSTDVQVSWTNPSDPDFKGVEVYYCDVDIITCFGNGRNNPLGCSNEGGASCNIIGLTPLITYQILLYSYDDVNPKNYSSPAFIANHVTDCQSDCTTFTYPTTCKGSCYGIGIANCPSDYSQFSSGRQKNTSFCVDTMALGWVAVTNSCTAATPCNVDPNRFCGMRTGIATCVALSDTPNCSDNTQNQDETGTDCGGPCPGCAGDPCVENLNCASGSCTGGSCD